MSTRDAKLPVSWSKAKIGELCSALQYGYTASATTEPCGPRFLRITDIQDGAVEWPTVPYCKIDSDQLERVLLHPGDIVFARTGGTVGKSYIITSVPEAAVFASYLIRLTPHSEVFPRFLYYFFQSTSYWEQIGRKKGGLQGNVNATMLSTLEIPLCPIDEQRRIVAKIEEIFSELDRGVESLTIAREQLRAYRRALLNQAVSGALLVSHSLRASPFDDSVWKPLSSAISSLGQGWSPRCLNHPSADGETWAVITTTAIQHGAFFDHENKQLPDNLEPRPHLSIAQGDILVTRAGPRKRVGVACLVRRSRSRLMLCDKAYRLRVNESDVLPEWLELVLNSPGVLRDVEELKTGMNDSGVNLTQDRFLSLRVPIPPRKCQQDTLNVVESSMSQISNMEKQLELSLTQTESLRQAILQRAFSGRMVAQDASDGTAAALLDRIRAEQTFGSTKKRSVHKNNKKKAA